MKKNTLAIIGGILMLASGLFTFSPLAIAALNTQPGHNMWSEGDSGSGGSAIWLMLFTLPLGFMGGVTGLVLLIVGLVKASKNKG
jgi:hypothetical protein